MRQELSNRCAEVDGVAVGEGAFALGLALWVGKREIAYFDEDGVLDVRLTKEVIRGR